MSQDNTEFYNLLNEISTNQSFDLTLTNDRHVACKTLTTAQLKELIKTIVDSPLTQVVFNSTATKILSQSVNLPKEEVMKLNVVDRLLFLIETRIRSLTKVVEITHDNKKIQVNFETIIAKLHEQIKAHKDVFASKTFSDDKIKLTFSVPLLKTEMQMNDELYKDTNVNAENANELRSVLGEAFVNEIAKTINTIEINDKSLDLSTVTFKSRLKTIESLPASLVQHVIEYIESYKKIIDQCLDIEGYSVPIDGSLFSIR